MARLGILRPLAVLATVAGALTISPAGAVAEQTARAPDQLSRFASSQTDVPERRTWTVRRSVYVPGYARLRLGSGKGNVDFGTTLSIHNASEAKPLVIERIDYFDTAGQLVQRFIGRPIAIRPVATIEIFVAADDIRAGSGANFIVGWAASAPMPEPIIEAVMLGTLGTNAFALVSRGQPTDADPK